MVKDERDEYGALVPPGVVTVNDRSGGLVAASAAMVMVIGKFAPSGEATPLGTAVTPNPLNVTAVAPVKLVPVIDPYTVVPCVPPDRVMFKIVGGTCGIQLSKICPL